MSNTYFQFKQFNIQQDRCAMKVTTDSCLFGAWIVNQINNEQLIINNLLDIGTGTGLLTLTYAQKNSHAQIDAIEIDEDSFEQAKENIAASPWDDRIKIFHGDARNFEFPYKYDVIISNPPFYENELKSDNLKRNLALHGNKLALDELLLVIQSNLSETGIFFLLLPYKRQEDIRKIFEKYKFSMRQIIFIRQSVKHDYFRMIIMGKRKSTEFIQTSFDEISIRNDPSTLRQAQSSEQQYTQQFVELLKDYYLYL